VLQTDPDNHQGFDNIFPGQSSSVKKAAFFLSIVCTVLGAIPMIMSFAGLWRCRVGCSSVQDFEFKDEDASFWPLPLGAFGADLVSTILVGVLVVNMGRDMKLLQMIHFLVIPPVVVAALFTEGVIISFKSFDLGVLSTLFCPISGCQVLCNSFECGSCDVNIGACTLAPMRVVIFFFVVLRIITMVFNILLWRDATTGTLSRKLGAS
jgi:hypothetical protein